MSRQYHNCSISFIPLIQQYTNTWSLIAYYTSSTTDNINGFRFLPATGMFIVYSSQFWHIFSLLAVRAMSPATASAQDVCSGGLTECLVEPRHVGVGTAGSLQTSALLPVPEDIAVECTGLVVNDMLLQNNSILLINEGA